MSETTAPAAPFISQSPGSFEDQETGGPLFPSTISDTTDWFDTTRALGRQFLRGVAEGGMQDPMTGVGQNIVPPEETTAPETLQQQYGIPGKLTFDRALPEDVAESIYNAKRSEIMRADAWQRKPTGLAAGATRYGAQFVADLLDPVNLAATMIPIAPEIDLGVTAASPLLERIGQRAVQGAVGGAAGMAPLAGLKYVMGRQEQADYDGYNVLADIATGAGIGTVLHVGGGALGDWLTGRVRNSAYGAAIEQSPEARMAALRTALSQMADDQPVEVRPVFDATTQYVMRSNASEGLRVRLLGLQREADQLRSEAAAVPNVLESAEHPETMLQPPEPDPVTKARQDAILEELTDPEQPPTAARRADLMQEFQLLHEGAAPGNELEQARSASQRSGLITAAERIEAQIEQLRDQDSELARPSEPATTGDTPADHATTLDAALRSASGERPPNPVAPAADAAAKALPDGALKTAQQQIEDHEEFFRRTSEANQTREPPVPEGMTRLYRGETDNPGSVENVPDWIKEDPRYQATVAATGRWFVKDREVAEYYNREHGIGDQRVSYVDVPTRDVESYLSANHSEAKQFSAAGRENEEYFIPRELADQRTRVPLAPTEGSPYAGLTEDVRAELEALHGLDTDAHSYTEAAMQAAACVARGLAGEA